MYLYARTKPLICAYAFALVKNWFSRVVVAHVLKGFSHNNIELFTALVLFCQNYCAFLTNFVQLYISRAFMPFATTKVQISQHMYMCIMFNIHVVPFPENLQ